MRFQRVHWLWYVSICMGFALLGWVSFKPSSAPEWIMNVALAVCRSQTGLHILFYLAVTFHVGEAMFCWLRITQYNIRMKRYLTIAAEAYGDDDGNDGDDADDGEDDDGHVDGDANW